MQIKTTNLSGRALSWVVATLNPQTLRLYYDEGDVPRTLEEAPTHEQDWEPHVNYLQSGRLFHELGVSTSIRHPHLWDAVIKPEHYSNGTKGVKKERIMSGPTPMVAGLRVLVAAFKGDVVEVPGHLLEQPVHETLRNIERPRG